MSDPTKGRMNRSTYLLANIVYVLVLGAFFFIALLGAKSFDAVQGANGNNAGATVIANIFAVVFWILILIGGLWVGVFATIRRLHDMGMSGWWALLFYALSSTIILAFLPGQQEKNQYGKVPKKRFDWSALLFDKQ